MRTLIFSLLLLGIGAHAQSNDPYFLSSGTWGQSFDDQWGLKSIGIDSVPESEIASGERVVVAVIDSGLDYFHIDIAENSVWRNAGELPNGVDDDNNGYVDDLIGWNFVDNDNNPWDWLGHGTHVAGIIAAASNNELGISSVNPNAVIMPLKVMNLGGNGFSSRIAKAIYYAVAQGADIINLSMAVNAHSPLELKAINYAHEMGVVVVAAAGNAGSDTSDFGPASFDAVITVAAVDSSNQRSNFSNWGSAVDIAAPGVDILSLRAARTDFNRIMGVTDYKWGQAYVGEHADYYRASGTSFAAPFVTGVASLLRAKYPDATPDDIKRMLVQSARDIDAPGVDQYSGYGLLDARAAMQAEPGFFVETAISGVGVVQIDGTTYVQVSGTAAADDFETAWIELGAGENPAEWKQVSRNFEKAVHDGVLDAIGVENFAGAAQWTIRLITVHRNGRRREARFVLNLG